MSETKPTNVGAWATDDQVDPTSGEDNVAEPGASRKQSGWDRHDPVFRQWLNWLGRIGWQWRKWLDERLFDGATTSDFTIKAPDTEGGDVKVLGGTTDGTANQSGGDVTIASGDSTGTGSSDVILSAAIAGASGTGARAAEAFATLNGATGEIDVVKPISSTANITTTANVYADTIECDTVQSSGSTVTINDTLDVSGNLKIATIQPQVITTTFTGAVQVDLDMDVSGNFDCAGSIEGANFLTSAGSTSVGASATVTIVDTTGYANGSYLLTVRGRLSTTPLYYGSAIIQIVESARAVESIGSTNVTIAFSSNNLQITNNTGSSSTASWTLLKA